MKKIISTLTMVAAVLFLGGCNFKIVPDQPITKNQNLPVAQPADSSPVHNLLENIPTTVPETELIDFNFIFKYGVGTINELDTFNQIYIKDTVVDLPITIEFKLTDNELIDIYQKINDLGLFDKNEEPIVGGVSVMPCSSYYLKTQTGSIIKELSWDNCHGEIGEKFQQFSDYLIRIIESKEEYKALPTLKGGYL